LARFFAIPKALKCAGITLDQVDLIELNEAFASQSIYIVKTLGIDMNRLNVNGALSLWAILWAVPVSILQPSCFTEMERRKVRFGLVTYVHWRRHGCCRYI